MRIKRSSILTKIVLVVLLIYALVMLVMIGERKSDAQAALDELKRQESALAAENDGLQYALDHPDDPEVWEDMARDEGYINPNEETYYAGRVD